eukprot:scaffold12.g7977.t1
MATHDAVELGEARPELCVSVVGGGVPSPGPAALAAAPSAADHTVIQVEEGAAEPDAGSADGEASAGAAVAAALGASPPAAAPPEAAESDAPWSLAALTLAPPEQQPCAPADEPASPRQLPELPPHPQRKLSVLGEPCSFCLEPLSPNSLVLPCGHAHHSVCTVQFLFQKRECPCCRTKVVDPALITVLAPDASGALRQFTAPPAAKEGPTALNITATAAFVSDVHPTRDGDGAGAGGAAAGQERAAATRQENWKQGLQVVLFLLLTMAVVAAVVAPIIATSSSRSSSVSRSSSPWETWSGSDEAGSAYATNATNASFAPGTVTHPAGR